MFLETFCILCLIFTVGYFIIAPAKSAWDKLPSNPNNEACEVSLNGDTLNYELWFRGKTCKESQWASVKCSFENHVNSLEKKDGYFVAEIQREKYPLIGPLLRKDIIKATNLNDLAKDIEKTFESWDKEAS